VESTNQIISQALNLLSSKDPIAYQMVSAVTPQPVDTTVYNGPYVTGEEYALLLDAETQMDDAWKKAQENLED
jgi:hypothetical protein